MPTAVIMPKMEMSQETGQVIEWLKKEGEWVEKGEGLLVVETDKVTVEVESPGSGFLTGILVPAGETVPVSTVIAHLLARGEKLSPAARAEPRPGATPLAMRMAEDNQIDIKTVVGTGPAGKVTKNDVVSALAGNPPDGGISQASEVSGKIRATPAARKLAGEKNLPLSDIPGSGPRGRVQRMDVDHFTVSQPPSQAEITPSELSHPDEEVIPFNGIRRTIAERLQHSYQTAPHITLSSRVDLSQLNDLRKRLNARAETLGEESASMTAFLVKIVAWALVRNPWINSSLQGERIILHHRAHVGVAVALKTGLIVPVVHDADQKGIARIAREVKDLSERARQSRLTPADVAGGTFTISNLGPFEVEQFTAILNPGQTGILAVGSAREEALVIEGAVVVRPVMHLTLSVDHRVADGAVAAYFMRDLNQALEQPGMLLW